jgi:hypothetical protein
MFKIQRKRGSTLLSALMLMSLLSVAGMTYMSSASGVMSSAKRKALDVQMTQLCDAGVQTILRSYWRDFKQSQAFDLLTTDCTGASIANPKAVTTGTLPNVGMFSSAVINYSQPAGDPYTRTVTIRAVGFVDRNGNGTLDTTEPAKVVDVKVTFLLKRSQVFDYVYFVNNFGWMSGFGENDLYMNGDLRANGDFSFTGGVPTVNGTVIATQNDKLNTGTAGNIIGTPVKWTDSSYRNYQAGSNPYVSRMRQAYDPAKHGARGSTNYELWRDVLFDTKGNVLNNKLSGSTLTDSSGSKGWIKTNNDATATYNQIDPAPSEEVVMPDLGDITDYQDLSNSYVDNKATFADGTVNPKYGQGAYVDVWNSSTNAYVRLTTNGYVNGSAVLVGTSSHPIVVHGPVTVLQDAVIKGYVSGQGTIYTGRNVHVVGSIRYNNPPDFRGNDQTAIDSQNEKADLLGLAARASVMMGNPNGFNSTTLYYMSPPFTKERRDENGNAIPAFNATEVDSSGRMKYQSVIPDSTMNSIAEGINQIDAVMYTNFVGGGNLGTSGGGVGINGSIISRDEAMIIYSLPMSMNYDARVKERTLTQKPLVDIKLPRSPVLMKSTWQDRGTTYGSQ